MSENNPSLPVMEEEQQVMDATADNGETMDTIDLTVSNAGPATNITIRVLDGDSNEIHFLVKPTIQLGRVKRSYARRVDRNLDELRFLFDGRHVKDEETPIDLEMVNGDVIEVYVLQTGGS